MEKKPAFITAKKYMEQVNSDPIKKVLASLYEILHAHEELLQEIEEVLDAPDNEDGIDEDDEDDEDFEPCESFSNKRKKGPIEKKE